MITEWCWKPLRRYRTGSPWRDLPSELGRWQTVWARHFRWSTDGTYERILAAAKSAGFAGDVEGAGVDQLLSVDSTVVRAHQHAAGARKRVVAEVVSTAAGHTGASSNDMNVPVEAADHALGRSRGGLSTKIHTLTDQRARPVTYPDPGPVRRQPAVGAPVGPAPSAAAARGAFRFRVLADRAYSHPSTRKELRRRRIGHTIPQRTDQQAQRKAKGSRGGRPPGFDADAYSLRNAVERGYARLKQWRGIATRYDKHALTFLGGLHLAASVLHLR